MMQPALLTGRLRQILAAPTGLAGTLILFALFIGRAIGWAGDMDFVAQHWTSITQFLQGWGMLLGVFLGAALIAKAIYDTSLLQPRPSLQAGQDNRIDPWLPSGKRTFARVLIDTNNWRIDVLKRENVFEVKGRLLNAAKSDVQLVVIFQRWTLERGGRISADNKLRTYHASEDAFTERYAIYSLYGIKTPCIVEIALQSDAISFPEDEEAMSAHT